MPYMLCRIPRKLLPLDVIIADCGCPRKLEFLAHGHPAQCRKAARVRIEQHLVALAGIGHQLERTAGAQLHVRDL
jgi:hypothetical protein